ncbi:DUF771 domain-containing protein [Paenibacillus larvae]|uniref:DUF771 domain-containing protein n=1 Tax=Paenibacillus larvae TaxID=1464 RepID=UPI002282AC0B|nr:DUF771 domain-containing protein [Paenibacillus larvae]MCY9500045.1 DUF771 domain-containing protein [Paenibacillus larvae]
MPFIKVEIDEELLRELAKEEVKKILEGSEGCWWDLKRLEAETCRKRDWLIENILLNPEFKSEMNKITNKCENGRWMFKASEMKLFLEGYFHYLNSNKRSESA